MKRLLSPLSLLTALICIGCGPRTSAKGNDATDLADTLNVEAEPALPREAMILIKAYPDLNLTYSDNKIFFPDSTYFVFDDRIEKDFVTKLDNSDIEDMFSLLYDKEGEPDYLADAGRSRCDPFFKKIYGSSSAEVQKNLVNVEWFGQKVKFTSVNGANKQLEKVAAEIAETYPDLVKFMKSSGTFYWRQVRGANRQSAHSYGIAIDINTEYSDYWRWKFRDATETQVISYYNRIPMEIVQVFEKYGFVWGGRWYHFDTMHFEYRPEIIHLTL